MPKARNPLAPVLTRTDDPKADKNLRKVVQEFDKLSPAAAGKVMEVVLSVGNNTVRPPMKNPQGAFVTYQSAAGAISMLGSDGAGGFIINSAVACTAKISFH